VYEVRHKSSVKAELLQVGSYLSCNSLIAQPGGSCGALVLLVLMHGLRRTRFRTSCAWLRLSTRVSPASSIAGHGTRRRSCRRFVCVHVCVCVWCVWRWASACGRRSSAQFSIVDFPVFELRSTNSVRFAHTGAARAGGARRLLPRRQNGQALGTRALAPRRQRRATGRGGDDRLRYVLCISVYTRVLTSLHLPTPPPPLPPPPQPPRQQGLGINKVQVLSNFSKLLFLFSTNPFVILFLV
jgi:hypothetical protein